MQLILASGSPRRHQILSDARIGHQVRIPAGVAEDLLPNEEPTQAAIRLARVKAHAVAMHPGDYILGADTMVVIGDTILNKPADAGDAARMLRLLSGAWHEVVTGVCVRHPGGAVEDASCTRVHFLPLSERDIASYVETGEPMDKAGAYGIQGQAARFIDSIEGCYFNVVGLPVSLVWRMLLRAGNDGRVRPAVFGYNGEDREAR